MRHNRVRDLEAELMKEVCHNVQIEPQLLPIESDRDREGNTATRARLDVAGIGVWGHMKKPSWTSGLCTPTHHHTSTNQ